EDLTVVVKAEMADDYLRSKYGINASKPSDIERKIVDDIMKEFTAKEKALREAKAIVNKAEVSRDINDVDTLLDEINDYKALIKMFGDEDKKYELAICEAKAKLKELTEGGRYCSTQNYF